jgi:aminopeptidase-like protein
MMSLTQRRKDAKERGFVGDFAPSLEISSGEWMHAFATELFPICRSITGDGLRGTLRRIQKEIPITIHEVPSGTPVLDWTIPDEWNISDAWIANASGERVVDFRGNNLHIVSYSVPVRAKMSLAELRPHLHSLPDRPDWIPYRTTYYKRDWGFCLAHDELTKLTEGEYDVCLDATIAPGALSYGELVIPGEIEDEFLISTHCCHPSLANDNLSGIAVATQLAKWIASEPRRHSFRFLFAPGTIGAIAWLARNEQHVHRIKHGLVLTCVGDHGAFTYKRSRQGDAAIDRAVEESLNESGAAHRVIDFFPYGYDERQFCSPGFNLPVGCFMRSQHGTFPEYHTSADNLKFITAEALEGTLILLRRVIERVEQSEWDSHSSSLQHSSERTNDRVFLNLRPKGEPQLGKHGVYERLRDVMPALWVLNFSDGQHSLQKIAARCGLPFDRLEEAANVLTELGLLKEVGSSA